MSVNEVCDCLKNEILGLKTMMIPVYVQDFQEANISGRVLATCNIEELKQVRAIIKVNIQLKESFQILTGY